MRTEVRAPRRLLRHIFSLLVVFCAVTIGNATASSATVSRSDLYVDWDRALARYVDSRGDVDYLRWRTDKEDLESFLARLGKLTANDYSRMKRAERLALWINAYNAFTVKLVLDHYPIKRRVLDNMHQQHSFPSGLDSVGNQHVSTVNTALPEDPHYPFNPSFGQTLYAPGITPGEQMK